MRPIFTRQSDNNTSDKISSLVFCLTLIAIAISGCANITLQPKDPELIALRNFADQATTHLFEQNPLTYEKYQNMLDRDIAPNLLVQLKAKGTCAKSKDEIKSTVKSLDKTNNRRLILVQSITFPSKTTPQNLVPIEVQGTCVKTTNDISTASKFDVLYLIGTNVKTKQPIIASLEIKKFD